MHLTQMSPLAFRPVSQFVPLPTLAHKGDGQKRSCISLVGATSLRGCFQSVS